MSNFWGSLHTSLIIKQLNIIKKEKDIFQEKLIKLPLVALITYLEKNRQDTLLLSKSTMGSTHKFGRVLKYIGDNYSTCSLQEVAKKFGYNSDYLSLKFKKDINESFSKKIISIRLNKACELLTNTMLTVDEIIDLIGYKDKSFFYKLFKKSFSMTPLEYRKNTNKIALIVQ